MQVYSVLSFDKLILKQTRRRCICNLLTLFFEITKRDSLLELIGILQSICKNTSEASDFHFATETFVYDKTKEEKRARKNQPIRSVAAYVTPPACARKDLNLRAVLT